MDKIFEIFMNETFQDFHSWEKNKNLLYIIDIPELEYRNDYVILEKKDLTFPW